MKTGLKAGKVPQKVLDRSVFRPLTLRGVQGRQDLYGFDAAALGEAFPLPEEPDRFDGAARENRAVHTGGGCLGGSLDPTVEMYLSEQMNSLAAAGFRLRFLWITLVLPAGEPEETLHRIMERIAAWAMQMRVQILGGHTGVSDGVQRPVISLTGAGTAMDCMSGRAGRSAFEASSEALPEDGTFAGRGVSRLSELKDTYKNDDLVLVMAGYAGQAGTALLSRQEEKALRAYFPSVIVDEALRMGGLTGADESDTGSGEEPACRAQILCLDQIAALGWQLGAVSMHDVSCGGVSGALWEMAAREHFGLEADLKQIPIRQETIEICEWYDKNPYQLYGQGAMLMVMPQAAAQEMKWRIRDRKGLPACVEAAQGQKAAADHGGQPVSPGEPEKPLAIIGRIREGNEKIIRNGGEVRYLDKPQPDALYKV